MSLAAVPLWATIENEVNADAFPEFTEQGVELVVDEHAVEEAKGFILPVVFGVNGVIEYL